MPRRFLGVRTPATSNSRMQAALDIDIEAPNIDEIIESQDVKLQEIKRLVFSGTFGPTKLVASAPVPMSAVVNEMPNNHGLMISTHYNNHEQSLVQGGGAVGFVGRAPEELNEEEIDFSKAEAFLQLEAPIDARKDQNMLKLAYTIPKRTFMNRLLRKYPIHKKRLAFIQRKPLQPKPLEVVGNLVVSAKGGESKEVSISCQVCGQRFTKQHHFQRHLFMHPDPDSKKFLCQVCGKRFNRADHLNRHALLHGDVKVHKCLLCGEEFDRASHLDRHRRKHHPPAGQQPSQTPPLTPQLKSPPPMGAGFDGLSFVTNIESPTSPMENQGSNGNNLHLLAAVATPDGSSAVVDGQIHMDSLQEVGGDYTLMQTPVVMVNQGSAAHIPNINPSESGDGGVGGTPESGTPGQEPERPFPCMVCGRKFIRSTHLRRHMRIHTGEKPFACHICGRRYARGDYLRAHIQAHRRDKIHKCKHCGDVFRDLTRFADHCRLMHKDVNDEHGNPKPPPENSPPPPPISTAISDFLTAESAEEITVVPSSIAMATQQVAAPVMIANPNQNVPITLINLADSQDEVIISSLHQAPPTSSTHHIHPSHHHQHHQQLPVSMQAPPMTTAEMQLAHLQQTLGGHQEHQNQFLIPNSVPESANEVTVVSQLSKVGGMPSYIDPITQYIISNGNTNNSNMVAVSALSTPPHPAHLINQGLPPH